jgi:hypothetical protein
MLMIEWLDNRALGMRFQQVGRCSCCWVNFDHASAHALPKLSASTISYVPAYSDLPSLVTLSRNFMHSSLFRKPTHLIGLATQDGVDEHQ